MSDLREQLAKRFAALSRYYLLEQDPNINARGAMNEWNRILADECIRQMEWAQSRVDSDLIRQDPLTIAPDDWKPE